VPYIVRRVLTRRYSTIDDAIKMVVANKVDLVRFRFGIWKFFEIWILQQQQQQQWQRRRRQQQQR
jgi:hypothetical protein